MGCTNLIPVDVQKIAQEETHRKNKSIQAIKCFQVLVEVMLWLVLMRCKKDEETDWKNFFISF